MKPTSSIESRLHAVRSRIRRVQAVRAATVVATAALAGLLVVMAVDYFLGPLPTTVRWLLTGSWLVGVAIAARSGLAPLRQPVSLLQVARWLESRHPEMEERISTSLQLDAAGGGVSPGLLAALAQAADQDAMTVDATAEVKAARTTRRWGRPALALAALLLVALVVSPSGTARLITRAILPFSSVGNAAAGKFVIAPGDIEVLVGDAVEISVNHTGSGGTPELWLEMDDGTKISQPLTRIENSHRYRLDPVRQGFFYQVRAGRDLSDRFYVKAWPLPQLVDAQVTLDFPDYTGLVPRTVAPAAGVVAVVGTRATLTARTNTAVAAAWLDLAEKRLADGEVEPSASNGRVKISWIMKKGMAGEAVVTLGHRLDREIEALRFPMEAMDDRAPEVVILSPVPLELTLRPDESLPLVYRVVEDFGLAKVELEADSGGGRPVFFPLEQPLREAGGEIPIFRGETQVAIGQLRERLEDAREIRVRIRAQDKQPQDVGGPGTGYSEWITLRIDDSAESLARQELREEHDGAKQTVQESIEQVREARQQMDRHREALKRGELQEHASKNLQVASEKLATTEERLETLANQMKESVHAQKAEAVAKAAESVAKAREQLESAPLQDTPETRDAALQQAREDAETAGKQLEEVGNEMDRDRGRIDDLARVQELAQQQTEQARQAAAHKTESTPLPDEWRDRQQRIDAELKQQLQQRPEAKAAALQKQAAQAEALAELASETAKAQENLAEQAQQESPEVLQQALAAEQAKITAEAKAQLVEARESNPQMADPLAAATAAAETALENIEAGDVQAAAEAASEAAEAMAKTAADAPGDQTPESAPDASDAAGKDAAPPDAAADSPAEAGSPEGPEAGADSPPAGEEAAAGKDQAAESPAGDDPAAQAAGDESPAQGESPAADAAGDYPDTGKSAAGSMEHAQQSEALAELGKKQAEVASAMEALAKGDSAEALKTLQAARAVAAADLAEAIAEAPQLQGSGPMNEAKGAGQQGAAQAEAAAEQAEGNHQDAAAPRHQQSAAEFEKTADALKRAAEEFSRMANEAATQQSNPNQAPVAPAALAEAFQKSAESLQKPRDSADAAASSEAAAKALAAAAQAARQQMQGKQPGKPGQPGEPSGEPSGDPDDNLRTPEADLGVPPELAKLGISAADWEKIQSSLTSDVGAGPAGAVPAEYRELVRSYFESMSKTPAEQ